MYTVSHEFIGESNTLRELIYSPRKARIHCSIKCWCMGREIDERPVRTIDFLAFGIMACVITTHFPISTRNVRAILLKKFTTPRFFRRVRESLDNKTFSLLFCKSETDLIVGYLRSLAQVVSRSIR